MKVWTPRLTLFSVVLMAVLLIALGVLQYRWVGELSAFERQRMQDSLQTASERFRNDFARELDGIWETFVVRRGDEVPAGLAAAYKEWLNSLAFPELIDAVFWVSADAQIPEFSRFNPLSGDFEPSSWPPQLAGMRD